MNPRGNAHTLVQARRRDSLDKRQRVLTALTTLEQQGKKITHTAVARTAGVSTWLTYTEGIREHIDAAQQRQQPKTTRPADTRTPTRRCARNSNWPGRRSETSGKRKSECGKPSGSSSDNSSTPSAPRT
ncbi:hypothetical protein [Streptomyces sp. RTd22]|uniref:hypothetical protein n=1 Tax=Streptomyces sp. RTd22 TaxID=1841249 RepID=UPI001F22A33B|nr:hypothetical protein [Streptomyces sp. RTd22]